MNNTDLSRRAFLKTTGVTAAILAFPSFGNAQTEKESDLPPIRTITRGPKFHWFGYYDKLQFDPTCRYALGMEVDFEHREPKPDDVIKMGLIDLKNNDQWTELGTSSSWGWQQGCMLQWRPGSKSQVLWNDRAGDKFVCHLVDTQTKQKRTIPHPIYTISPDGKTAVSPDFRRINDMRPGYGYTGLPDPHSDELAPKDAGIARIDLETGKHDLIISLADIATFGEIPGNPKNAKHYFNHLLFNTDGSRFIFLHRWRPWDSVNKKCTGGFITRMLTATADGKDIRVVDPSGRTSHFIWRDPKHILAWSWHASSKDAFYLYEDGTDKVQIVGKDIMTRNGHCTYLPGNEWILNDTYPDKDRKQHVYLYHVATGKTVSLGRFYLPSEYTGQWRCDTHPRFSPDGRSVIIDSPHDGNGRQMHLIDISGIVG